MISAVVEGQLIYLFSLQLDGLIDVCVSTQIWQWCTFLRSRWGLLWSVPSDPADRNPNTANPTCLAPNIQQRLLRKARSTDKKCDLRHYCVSYSTTPTLIFSPSGVEIWLTLRVRVMWLKVLTKLPFVICCCQVVAPLLLRGVLFCFSKLCLFCVRLLIFFILFIYLDPHYLTAS